MLKDEDGRYVLPDISDLMMLRDPNNDTSDLGKLFCLVYVELPHKMKPGLRPDLDHDITLTKYLEEFPISLEALILMMFQTIPEYLIGEKVNENRLTKENKEVKEGFVVHVFGKYKQEVYKCREFHVPPDIKKHPKEHKEWNDKDSEGEFVATRKFYTSAVAALNEINKSTRNISF